MEHSFAHEAPETALYTTPLEGVRRKALFDLACERGLVLRDQPTPTAERLRDIIQNNVVVQDTSKLKPVDQPVPLASAHTAAPAEPMADAPEDEMQELLGTSAQDTSEAFAIYNSFSQCKNVFSLIKMFNAEFPDSEHEVPAGTKKQEILDFVKDELGIS